MSIDSTLKELKKISKILILSNAAVIENEIAKIASTNERKRIWVLIDGIKMPADIAKEANTTAMTVSNFLNAGKFADLVNYTKGLPPQRILDYVPPAWIDLVKITGVEEKKVESEKKNEVKRPEEKGEGAQQDAKTEKSGEEKLA